VNERTARKAEAFAALHSGEPFVIPNPWDAGSARVLEALGFKALATTSSGFAFTLGRLDGGATLDEVVEHLAAIDRATGVPVSVDLENGYGADPASAAHAIERVAEAGAVGGSIEDYDPAGHLYDLGHAAERVTAAVEAARGLAFPFMLTARAENHIRGNPDLDDTIARLQAYERAGADVLYAPGLRTVEECLPFPSSPSRRSPKQALSASASAAVSPGSRSGRWRTRRLHSIGETSRRSPRGFRSASGSGTSSRLTYARRSAKFVSPSPYGPSGSWGLGIFGAG
jgi:2-methylisocitrate lyase-like PEP mutase family enzyme